MVPVAFAADNNYVPMLTTTIYSMLKNASTNRMYDVVVLERNITDENKRYIRQFFARFSNALIRFFDVNRYLAGFNLTTSNAHISIETYIRVVPEFLRTLVFARPRGDDQFADCTFSPSLDMSR